MHWLSILNTLLLMLLANLSLKSFLGIREKRHLLLCIVCYSLVEHISTRISLQIKCVVWLVTLELRLIRGWIVQIISQIRHLLKIILLEH